MSIHGIAVCCIWKHLGEVSADAYALSDGTQAPWLQTTVTTITCVMTLLTSEQSDMNMKTLCFHGR